LCGSTDGGLGRLAEEVRRVAHQVLVDGLVVRDHHRERGIEAAARATRLLPRARDRRREAHDHRRVERAHVDAELERVGRDHARELAREQPPLDRAPLLGQVAAAIGRDLRGQRRRLRQQRLVRVAVDDLGGDPRLGEHDRRGAAPQEVGEDPPAVAVRRPALELVLVEEARVPERDRLRAARGAVVVDHARLAADQREASSPGFRIVAEQQMKTGSAP
jgi:hypothetical protein